MIYDSIGINGFYIAINIDISPISEAFVLFLKTKEIQYTVSQESNDNMDIQIRINTESDIIKINKYLSRILLSLQDEE